MEYYKEGEKIVYLRHVHTTVPEHAHKKHFRPQPSGEYYDYDVEELFLVVGKKGKHVLCQKQTGEFSMLDLETESERVRRAKWWEALFCKNKWNRAILLDQAEEVIGSSDS